MLDGNFINIKMGDLIPVEVTHHVDLAVLKDFVIPTEFIGLEEDYFHRSRKYKPFKDGQFELFFLLKKLHLSSESAEEIALEFHSDTSIITDLKEEANLNPENKDLQKNYYLLRAKKYYYSSAMLDDWAHIDNYEETSFYNFFYRQIGNIDSPLKLLNGNLIILLCRLVYP